MGLFVAVEDRDFHNFIRHSERLRYHWCKMEIAKRQCESLEDRMVDYEKLEKRRNAQYDRMDRYQNSNNKRHYRRGSIEWDEAEHKSRAPTRGGRYDDDEWDD